MIMEKPGKCI